MKEKSLPSQLELSKHIGVDYATVKRWLKQYKEEGFDSLVVLKSGGKRRSVIDAQVHKNLSAKLNDSNNPLFGYWDGVLWVKTHHCIAIKYNTLRTYLIRLFHTKLKSPRKSHYKKEELTIETFKKRLPNTLRDNRISLNKNNFTSINLYFQYESRFGLMTHIGRCLTARGVKPIVKYQHAFKNTYLYGSFSPIHEDSFVYEIEGTTSEIFCSYLNEFSKNKPMELKFIFIDNLAENN